MLMTMVPLDPARTEEAASTLARAFMDDPLQSYVFPDRDDRARLSPAHFLPVVRYGLLAGEVLVTEGDIRAVGIWWPPEHREMKPEVLNEAGFNDLPETMGAEPLSRFMTVLDHVEPLHRRDAAGPHWYAMVLGVDPEFHGQGLGAALIEPIFAKADAAGVPCYLETFQPRNVGFYKHHGFEVMDSGVEPSSSLFYWTFKRAPRA